MYWGSEQLSCHPPHGQWRASCSLHGAATCMALGCSIPHTGEFLELSESSVSLCKNADKNLGGIGKDVCPSPHSGHRPR